MEHKRNLFRDLPASFRLTPEPIRQSKIPCMNNGRNESSLSSAQVARAAGISVDTLHHYEKKGVIPSPGRASNGYRTYPPSSVERVLLVRHALSIGFTLDELARILKARDAGKAPCRSVVSLAQSKLIVIEEEIEKLGIARRELQQWISSWTDRLDGVPDGTQARLLDDLLSSPKTGRPSAIKRRKS